MKKYMLFLSLFFLSAFLVYCSQEIDEKGKVLAIINDYNLMLDEFQSQLSSELEIFDDFKLTKEAKKDFLDRLITKEVLIQEAKKLKLDRKKEFIKTIERYWEATLIKNLLEKLGRQISKRILISEQEIEDYYSEREKADAKLTGPLEPREKVIQDLKERKKTKMLETWISATKQKAKIEINEDLLYKD